MEELLKIIAQKVVVSKELQLELFKAFELKSFSKNKLILKEGQYCKSLYFMKSGMVRTFYYHKDKDITSWCYNEDQFFTSWHSFYGNTPSFDNIETISECEIFSITEESFKSLIARFPDFAEFSRQLAEEQLASWDFYYKGYMHMSAKEKYDLLLSYFPDIELRMKLGHISSMLGISQETLSRIRAGK